jgi:hypothetical protein
LWPSPCVEEVVGLYKEKHCQLERKGMERESKWRKAVRCFGFDRTSELFDYKHAILQQKSDSKLIQATWPSPVTLKIGQQSDRVMKHLP